MAHRRLRAPRGMGRLGREWLWVYEPTHHLVAEVKPGETAAVGDGIYWTAPEGGCVAGASVVGYRLYAEGGWWRRGHLLRYRHGGARGQHDAPPGRWTGIMQYRMAAVSGEGA
jgi:hypothetical protein